MTLSTMYIRERTMKRTTGKRARRVKIAAAAMAAMMTVSMATPAMAATQYTALPGTTSTFEKFLIMKEDASVPNAEFAYTITGTGNARTYDVAGTNKKVQVLDGVGTPTITWDSQGATASSVKFGPTDATTTKAANDAAAHKDPVKNLAAGEKYAKHTATVSFANCNYTEPGIYRYKISETATTQKAITNDDNLDRYLDVYVVDNNGTLAIGGYVLHASADDLPMNDTNGTVGANPEGKSQGYSNRYSTHNLTFSKTVAGNQASRDKYFKFHVKIENATAGTVYTVSLADDSNANTTDGNADATPTKTDATVYTSMSNPTSLTANASGVVEADFYLQHGQSIVVRGLADTTKYTVTETQEDYKPNVTATEGTVAAAKNSVVVDSSAVDNTEAFTNTRNGVVPTGILMTVAPFAALTLCGGFGAATIVMKSRKKEEDEEE